MYRSTYYMAALCVACCAQPAAAQDSPAVAAANARAAEANARAAEIDAQTKLMQSRFTALGLTPAKGETTLSDGAGTIEAWMLSTATVNAVAKTINTAVKATKLPGTHVLLAGEDKIDPAYVVIFDRQRDTVVAAIGSTLAMLDCGRRRDGAEVSAMALPLIPAIGAALSLFRTDTELRGITVDVTDRALVSAIAAEAPGTWVVPAEMVALDANDPRVAGLDTVAEGRRQLVRCRLADAADKDAAAALDATLATVDSWFSAVLTPGTDGRTPLARAVVSAQLANALVLRVSVEKAGGSLIKRSNLWTALGAPAIGLTGGLIVSYRLSTPANGKVVAAGLLVCRTRLTNIKAVQANDVRADASDCSSGLRAPL